MSPFPELTLFPNVLMPSRLMQCAGSDQGSLGGAEWTFCWEQGQYINRYGGAGGWAASEEDVTAEGKRYYWEEGSPSGQPCAWLQLEI